MNDPILPGLPADLIRRCYAAAPGNELASGKFASPESSSALVANCFGLFLDRPAGLPVLPVGRTACWPPQSVRLEAEVRFPWRGGLHPWLDVLVETPGDLVGIESKRYEPFRAKAGSGFSSAFWRPVWGWRMGGFCRLRDDIAEGRTVFARLDAVQLVKHALALRAAVHRRDGRRGKRPLLLYLHAEPACWPGGRSVPDEERAMHRSEIARFAAAVAGDEVDFAACTYRNLLDGWRAGGDATVRAHAEVVRARYAL